MSRATGLLLILLGTWLIVATVAGQLPERILSLVLPPGGGFTGAPAEPGGGGGGGGGAW